MSMKNPLTLDGIEPATFRFVTQHLNHCTTAVPRQMYRLLTKYISSINLGRWHIYTNQHYIIQIGGRGCSVGTPARLEVGRPRNRGSIPDRGRRFFSSVNRPD